MIECQPFIKSQYQILRYGYFNIVASNLLRHMQRNANKRITIAPAKTDKRTVLTSLTIPDVSASLSLKIRKME